MNKAVPWNVNGVGFDAREAAREAARRQGKSLGEWLHGVIADHAADLGVTTNEMAGQEKIDAVTSKLERLSARSAEHDNRLRTGLGETRRPRAASEDFTGREPRRQEGPRQQRTRDEVFEEREGDGRPRRDRHADEPRRRRDSATLEAEYMLEDAIDAMEQRSLRAERRADKALQSMADMLERNESNRERERESVGVLARKLSDIESRLTDRLSQGHDNPIKGALARLEARLDTIGRRSAAETVARQQAADAARRQADETARQREAAEAARQEAEEAARQEDAAEAARQEQAAEAIRRHDAAKARRGEATLEPQTVAPASEPYVRLEEKLNSILDAVQARPRPLGRTSPVTLAAAQATNSRGRLDDAIADIARRQQSLEGGTVSLRDAILRRRNVAPHRRDEAPQTAPTSVPAPFAAMQGEIAALASKIEGLRQDVAAQRLTKPQGGIDAMRAEIAAMSDGLRDLAPRNRMAGLEESVRSLSGRIDDSRDRGIRERTLRPVVDDLRSAMGDLDSHEKIGGMQKGLRAIGGRIDDLSAPGVEPAAIARIHEQMQEIRDLIAATAAKPLAVDRIEHQIAVLSDRLDRQSRHPEASQDFGDAADGLRALIANPPGAAALTKIESRLEGLSAKIDAAVAKGGRTTPTAAANPSQASTEFAALETMVRDLGHKMEAVQAPGADHGAFDALQQQIAALSSRFERSDDGLSKLASLERSMRDLFVHLDETRASVETSAQRAAREVLRIAVEEGRAHTEHGTATSLATMQTLQEEAEARTSSTLSAVHETLEKVVDRLTSMETDIAEVRRRPPAAPATRATVAPPAPAAPAQGPAAQAGTAQIATAQVPAAQLAQPTKTMPAKRLDMSLGAPDPMMDQVLGHRPGETSARAPTSPHAAVDLDDEQRRASFIAAARRAAKTAQTDPSVAELTRPGVKTTSTRDDGVRASLIEQSRDYVARHKKPVLLSMAALFVIVGTMAIMQRLDFGGTSQQIADATPPAPITRTVDPAPQARQSADLTPSALPKNAMPKNAMAQRAPAPLGAAIPGSDPIQTGSIPSLPSFAAQGPSSMPSRPALPAGLKTMANAGDSAAEYTLGTQYAEGRIVPRDFRQAASWYQKAADQGVVPAQYRLASLYEKGLGVTQDKVKAKSLYLRAAEAGNPRAMHNLAVLLADGDGHPDYEGAATWFRKAAQYGIHDSQYNLAILLARGLGTQQSFVQSYQWFAIAAAQNDTDAAKKRDEVATRLGANDLAVAKALAGSFRPRVADVTATEVQPPPGGWDGASAPSPLNSPRAKISSL